MIPVERILPLFFFFFSSADRRSKVRGWLLLVIGYYDWLCNAKLSNDFHRSPVYSNEQTVNVRTIVGNLTLELQEWPEWPNFSLEILQKFLCGKSCGIDLTNLRHCYC